MAAATAAPASSSSSGWDFTCDFEIDYGSEVHATIVYKTVAVDKELQPEKVRREMAVSGGKLVVRFEAVEARVLRATFSAFVDLMVLVTKIIEEYSMRLRSVTDDIKSPLLEHEDIYRYIPQLGDEVMYLRQGHEEYLNSMRLSDFGPWNRIIGLKAVELCKIQGLWYTTYRGSGESCSKLALEFIDDTSSGFGKEFIITLLEPVSFPDFLVKRARFEAAIARKWSVRDKCKVWWDGVDGGSWWEGRVSLIRPKSSDFPERHVIQYKNDGSDHPHSPWELHDSNDTLVPRKHPNVDSSIRNILLSAVTGLQKTSQRNQDRYGLRSSRNKRESCKFPDTHLLEKKHHVSLDCWLMLLEHEDIYRYISQLGDEVMYLRQGHEEYLNSMRLSESGPWNRTISLKAVELCKIQDLRYTTYRISGASCCKLTLEFIDDTSSGFGKQFIITLRELGSFPDFLVERTWFEAAIARKWALREKCKVWWWDGVEGGSWWDGRVSLRVHGRNMSYNTRMMVLIILIAPGSSITLMTH